MVPDGIHQIFQLINYRFDLTVVLSPLELSLQNTVGVEHESFELLVGSLYLLLLSKLQQFDPILQVPHLGLLTNLSVPDQAIILYSFQYIL